MLQKANVHLIYFCILYSSIGLAVKFRSSCILCNEQNPHYLENPACNLVTLMTGYKSNRPYFYKISFRHFFYSRETVSWGDLTLALRLFFASYQIDKRRVTGLSGGQTDFKGVHARHQVPGLLQDFATKTWATGGNASRFLISIKMTSFTPPSPKEVPPLHVGQEIGASQSPPWHSSADKNPCICPKSKAERQI